MSGQSGTMVVDHLTVRFGDVIAVDDVSLTIDDGEIVALLGPSGCGKSTLLRAIAGLQTVDSGAVRRDGIDLSDTPPHRRNIGLMFQDHALFTHKDVGANIEFGLRMKKQPAAVRRARVLELLELVGLAGFEARGVDSLSGGQAQRVALARALAPEPALLLLDEPLGSLDRNLRDRLLADLGRLLRDAGQTALFVTHDRDEALSLADRVGVMSAGRLVQVGTEDELRRRPADPWVADFLGWAD